MNPRSEVLPRVSALIGTGDAAMTKKAAIEAAQDPEELEAIEWEDPA